MEKLVDCTNSLRTIFLGKKEISEGIKMKVHQKVVRASIVYGGESWTLSTRNNSKTVATKMRFLRKIKRITNISRI